jgi:hypothetical protein
MTQSSKRGKSHAGPAENDRVTFTRVILGKITTEFIGDVAALSTSVNQGDPFQAVPLHV